MKIHYTMSGTILLIQSMIFDLLLTQLWLDCLPLQCFLTALGGIAGVELTIKLYSLVSMEKNCVEIHSWSKIDN